MAVMEIELPPLPPRLVRSGDPRWKYALTEARWPHQGATTEYRLRLARWTGAAIRNAIDRQKERPKPAKVLLTKPELCSILEHQGWACAITGLLFWTCGLQYGPTIPTIDRIVADADYDWQNCRVVTLGTNGLKGMGTDELMLHQMIAALEREGFRVNYPDDVKR